MSERTHNTRWHALIRRTLTSLSDKSLDKATIAEGLLVDIISPVLRCSLPLKPSVWMPVFVRLSAVQNTVHQREARIAANLLGARLHVQEPDLNKAKESAERAVTLAKDDTRYQGTKLDSTSL